MIGPSTGRSVRANRNGRRDRLEQRYLYCRGRIGSIVENRNIPQHRASRIYVHHLSTPILILLEDTNLATDNYKEPSRRFP